MAMMDVRIMRMTVVQPFMLVHVRGCLRQQLGFGMMLVMLIVTMAMLMLHGFVKQELSERCARAKQSPREQSI